MDEVRLWGDVVKREEKGEEKEKGRSAEEEEEEGVSQWGLHGGTRRVGRSEGAMGKDSLGVLTRMSPRPCAHSTTASDRANDRPENRTTITPHR